MNDLRGLYIITDTKPGLPIEKKVEAALNGGARLVQYRDKSGDTARRLREARELAALCRRTGARLIINDDVALARAVNADGVHLGRDDGDIGAARNALGESAIIGVSCYNDFERAEQAHALGASYVAFGSVFPSPTKPDAVRAPLELFRHARQLNIPTCAIGGIDSGNIRQVRDAGADMAAVISAVFDADDVETATRKLREVFER